MIHIIITIGETRWFIGVTIDVDVIQDLLHLEGSSLIYSIDATGATGEFVRGTIDTNTLGGYMVYDYVSTAFSSHVRLTTQFMLTVTLSSTCPGIG